MNPVDNFQKELSFYSRIFSLFVRTQNINFWVLLAFLPTFVTSRFIVYHFPDLFLLVGGVHIHHMTYGIFLLAISGLWSLNIEKKRQKVFNAVLFGAGLALSFDEFGMWIRLEDNYWIRQSYDAVVIITAILVNIVYFSIFWKKILGLYKRVEDEQK